MKSLIVILLNFVVSIASLTQGHAGNIESTDVSGCKALCDKVKLEPDGQFEQTPGQTADTIQANNWFAKAETFANARNYDSATIYCQKAAAIYQDAECWQKFVQCYNSIGTNSRKTGKIDTAKEYLEQALETGVKELGKASREVTNSYYNLGVVYSHRSDYDKAIEYFEESLSIRIELLGGSHPDVASSYNAIGSVYYAKGNYDKTLECCFQSLSIRLETLDDDHPKIVSSYNNIGLIYLEKVLNSY